jgi:hypothetical protein
VISLGSLVYRVALAIVIACPPSVSADSVVVPNSLTAAEGDGAVDAGPNIRIQQVYGAADFGGLGVIQITGLALRPDAASGVPFGPDTIAGLQVRLSTTGKAVDGLSLTFAQNIGPDETTVFNGDWTRSSADSPGPGGTRAFDIILTFMTPFTYDSAQGNLLVDFIDTSPPLATARLFPTVDAHSAMGDSVSAIAGNANDSSGVSLGGTGVVTQFAFVPEPSSCALLGLGGSLLASIWRRRRVGRQGTGVA